MKITQLFLLATLLLAGCKATRPAAQATSTAVRPDEVIEDKEARILRGLINRRDLETDSVHFKWFIENRRYGQADAAAVKAFHDKGTQFQLVVFGGTWCHDTQNLLPVLYRLTDLAGYPDQQITLIGVDRAKTTLDNLHTAFHITNVPTFIVMKNGKEVGRVVEYGKYSQIDKELGEIVTGL